MTKAKAFRVGGKAPTPNALWASGTKLVERPLSSMKVAYRPIGAVCTRDPKQTRPRPKLRFNGGANKTKQNEAGLKDKSPGHLSWSGGKSRPTSNLAPYRGLMGLVLRRVPQTKPGAVINEWTWPRCRESPLDTFRADSTFLVGPWLLALNQQLFA